MACLVEDIGAVVKGLGTTFKHMFRAPTTVQYPEQRRPVYPRFRGKHKLMRYENGLERCIGCSLCAGVCPAKAIYVEAEANTDERRVSPGERYAKRYEINMIRCIFCGYCQEVCPTEAIVLGHDLRAGRLRPRLLRLHEGDAAGAGPAGGRAPGLGGQPMSEAASSSRGASR